jgi:hypothetical protein
MTTQTKKPPDKEDLLGFMFNIDRALGELESCLIRSRNAGEVEIHRLVLHAWQQVRDAKRRLTERLVKINSDPRRKVKA